MNSQIKYWQNVILSNKHIEPKSAEQLACYKIAEFLLSREKLKMAIIIKTNGDKENIEPANGSTFTLKELQGVVNGYIQIVPIQAGEYDDNFMVIDEEGLLKPNPQFNQAASIIAGRRIVGQVVIIDKEQID